MGTQPPPQKGHSPVQYSAHVCCGQTAWWIKMPLGMEVGLSPGHIVLGGDPAPPHIKGRSSPPLFGPCLLWPNGRPSQQLLSSRFAAWFLRPFSEFVRAVVALWLSQWVLIQATQVQTDSCSDTRKGFQAKLLHFPEIYCWMWPGPQMMWALCRPGSDRIGQMYFQTDVLLGHQTWL